MSSGKLPDRPSLEYLRKLAKDRLRTMRAGNPDAKLSDAQLAVAREHGFPSWRALKADVDLRSADDATGFLDACASGDGAVVAEMLAADGALAGAVDARRPHAGWTALHTAAAGGHAAVVRQLLAHGADPDAREAGDETTPLHWAAARGDLETIRALLDAGADVHGAGDVHALDVIGWATAYRSERDIAPDVVALLTSRGARHHIYSAIAVGDAELIRRVIRDDPAALARRMSRFEHDQSPLHYAIERGRPDLVPMLIDAGADVNAKDRRGLTAFDAALGRGLDEAARLLLAAGATPRGPASSESSRAELARLAKRTSKGVPMIGVPDIAAALDWYTGIGFTEVERYADDGVVNFAYVTFGGADVMFGIHERPNAENTRLWFYTDEVDALYRILKDRQLASAQARLLGAPTAADDLVFDEELYDPFYGGRQFSVRDPHGYSLIFYRVR